MKENEGPASVSRVSYLNSGRTVAPDMTPEDLGTLDLPAPRRESGLCLPLVPGGLVTCETSVIDHPTDFELLRVLSLHILSKD